MESKTIDEQIYEKYKDYSEAEKIAMGHGALAVWALIAPERFGHKMRSIGARHQKAINMLRTMFNANPNRGKHIKCGRRVLAANLLLRDGIGI